jgi:hypothetical protein
MSDQHDDWWRNSAPPPTPPQTSPPRSPADPFARDPDATVVVPTRQPSNVQARPAYGAPPQQTAPQQQQFGAPPQQAPPSYGGPQFVDPTRGPVRKYRAPGGAIAMIGGALLAIISTFLPWVTDSDFDFSVNGYETYPIGEGINVVLWSNPGAWVAGSMVLVILMGVIVLAAGRSVATWLLSIFAVGLAGLMTLAAFGAVRSVIEDRSLSIGFGIALCVLSSLVTAVGALVVAVKKR